MNGGWEGGFVPPQGKEDASIIEAVNNGGRGEAAGRGGGSWAQTSAQPRSS